MSLCINYFNSEKVFSFRDFFILAQGNMSYREFAKVTGLSVFAVQAIRDVGRSSIPSLLTVRKIAAYTKVDAEELWLKVCRQVFREEKDFKLHRR